jgi:L-alanine-DL-glutamate epimerase-like enolase superfamily enzyme
MSDPIITQLRVALVTAPLETPIVAPFGTVTTRHNIIVRIETDDGAWGFGEAWGNFPPWGCRDRIEILTNVVRPLLVGRRLDDPATLYRMAAEHMQLLANQLGATGPFQQALCGADIALWDLAARRAGVPLADHLRGATSPRRAEVYSTNLPIKQPEVIAQMALKGHTRFKFRIAGADPVVLDRLAEARNIAGARPLMADATQSLRLEELRAAARRLWDLSLAWLEEPLPVHDLAAYRAWRSEPIRPPVALGENTYRSEGFRRLVQELDPEIIQPDITKTGGLSEGREICRELVRAGKRVCLHMYGGPVGLYASAHLAAAVDGVSWLEMDSMPNPLFDKLLRDTPVVRDGWLTLPAGTGLGDDLVSAKAFDDAEVH